MNLNAVFILENKKNKKKKLKNNQQNYGTPGDLDLRG
jgi:hypothetical protein